MILKNGPMTTIVNEDGTERDFSFDYSFWSHDGFDTDAAGYMSPQAGTNYAD